MILLDKTVSVGQDSVGIRTLPQQVVYRLPLSPFSKLQSINTLPAPAAPLSLTMAAEAAIAEVFSVNILEGLTAWSAVSAGALTLVYLFFLAVGEEYICNSAPRESSRL